MKTFGQLVNVMIFAQSWYVKSRQGLVVKLCFTSEGQRCQCVYIRGSVMLELSPFIGHILCLTVKMKQLRLVFYKRGTTMPMCLHTWFRYARVISLHLGTFCVGLLKCERTADVIRVQSTIN